MAIRIALADDLSITRAGLSAMLKRMPGVELVAEASNGQTLLQACRDDKPGVVVIALRRSPVTSLAVIRAISECEHPPRILCIGDHENPLASRAMLNAGAHGYLPISSSPEELREAIFRLSAGRKAVSESMEYGSTGPTTLGPRERQILWQVAQGLPNKAIAQQHGISVRTVGNHLQHAFQKLGAANRVEAVLRARQYGLLPNDS